MHLSPPSPREVPAAGSSDRSIEFQWGLIAEEDGRGILAVPADGMSWVGSGDLAIREAESGTKLVLRCRESVRLSKGTAASGSLTGRIGASDLQRATDLCGALERAEVEADPYESEIERDLEYEEWLDGWVRPARVALEARAEAVGESGVARPMNEDNPVTRGELKPFVRPMSVPTRALRRARWAASLLFVLSLGLAGGWYAERSTPLRNPVIGFLYEGATRGGAAGPVIELTKEATRFTLYLSVPPGPEYPTYELRIERDGAEVASVEGLVPARVETDVYVITELAADPFESGDYTVSLLGSRSEGPVEVALYAMRVTVDD